jgi:Kef-type K+ transport system membrane component KefB
VPSAVHTVIHPADMPDMAVVLGDLALVLVLARAVGWLFSRFGQPAVIGEILAGVLLGPSLLGKAFSGWLFPGDERAYLSLLANVGLVLFMFIVGLELDIGLIRGRATLASAVSVTSIALPFALGVALATYLPRPSGIGSWPFALFIGAAMSVTAFPVLARILTERNMHRTETGALALACAAVDDVLAWTLLAVVIAISGVGSAGRPPWLVALAVPFAVAVLVLVRPQLNRLTTAYDRAGRLTPAILAVVLVGLLLCAGATDLFGIHFIFGAFLFGAAMPREGAATLRHEILVRLEQISVLLLLPVFFLISGLSVNLRGLTGDRLLKLVLILAAAIGGKYIGAYAGARIKGVRPWQAQSLGILMNTRGLTELVILNVGLTKGLIGPDVFTMLVVMALVTTMMTGPLLRLTYPERRVARDVAEAERAALGLEPVGLRVLIVEADAATTLRRFDVALDLIADERPAEIVLSSIQPFGSTRLEVGSGLSEELAAMTESMSRLEQLVHRGAQEDVSVNVVTRFSTDIAADLLAQIEAIRPRVVLLGAEDDVADVVASEAPCQVAMVNDASFARHPKASMVHVSWGGSADDDAAVVIGLRIASYNDIPVTLEATSGNARRRVASLIETLRRRGVAFASSPPASSSSWTIGAVSHTGLDIAVRAEPDPEPIDWSAVRVSRPRSVAAVDAPGGRD